MHRLWLRWMQNHEKMYPRVGVGGKNSYVIWYAFAGMYGFIDSSYVATLVSYVSQRMFYVRWILLLIPNQKTWAVVFYACYVFPYFPTERGPRVIVPISGKEDLAEILDSDLRWREWSNRDSVNTIFVVRPSSRRLWVTRINYLVGLFVFFPWTEESLKHQWLSKLRSQVFQ